MKMRNIQFRITAKALIIWLLIGVAGMMKGYTQSFTMGNLSYTVNSDGVSVTVSSHINHNAATGLLNIPEIVSYDGTDYIVNSIGNQAFRGCNGLIGNLIIPNSITTIGNYAFYGCYGFTGNLVIPNSVTDIGDYAFQNCSGFKGSLTIGNSVTSIGNQAFMGCSGFTGSLTIPNSVTIISDYAFFGCSGFTNSLTIGDSVMSIGNFAFRNCSGFTGDLNIPNSVTLIGNSAFYHCSGFTGNLIIGNSVTTIGVDAFRVCRGFTGSLTIGNSVMSIGNYAFMGCSGFTGNLTIPNSVTQIGNYAFSGCSGFTDDLVIPDSVVSIGLSSFTGTAWYNNQPDGILYLSGCCLGYKGQKPTGVLNIQDGTRLICGSAFSFCNELTGCLIIPNSVTMIGEKAFQGCTFTGNLFLGNSMTTIGEQAFIGCSGFTGSLTIPNSVTTIENYAFYNCTGFTGSLNIGNSVNTIGSSSFLNCRGLESISVETDNSVFDSRGNCNAIINTSTNELVFGCKNTIIPNSITKIGDYAFSGCNSLIGRLTIPNSVTSIGNFAFYDCSGITNLCIPNSVTTINFSAFSGCSGLTGHLTIPNSVTYIGGESFRNCSGLSEVLILGAIPPSLGYYAYENTTCSIYVIYESLETYKTATYWSDYEDRIYPMAYTTIPAYSEGSSNWRFIASPLADSIAPTAIETIISETEYDLYQFNPSGENGEWENYKADSFNLVNGKGYLYANAGEVNVIFKGEFNENETQEVELVYNEVNPHAGWNLVGNPFPVSAYINKPYYVMNENGSGINPTPITDNTPIPACTAVFVKATGTNDTVVFTKVVQ